MIWLKFLYLFAGEKLFNEEIVKIRDDFEGFFVFKN